MRNMFFTASTNRFMRESCDSPLSYNLESAARLANLFLGRRAECMRVNGQLARQLAVAQHLDGIRGTADKAVRAKQFRSDCLAGWKNVQFFQIHDRVRHAKRIVEATLGHAAMQRHLPAFKSAAPRITAPGFLPLVAGTGGLAELGPHAAAHTHLFLARARRRLQVRQREGTPPLRSRFCRLVLAALAGPAGAA